MSLKKKSVVSVPANTFIDVDQPEVWNTIFEDSASAYFWCAKKALKGEIPLIKITTETKKDYKQTYLNKPQKFMRGNIFVVEATRGLGVSLSKYHIIYDSRMNYSLMKVPANASTSEPDRTKAKKSGQLLIRALNGKTVDSNTYEYRRVGAAILYRAIGGRNGDPKSITVNRVIVNPTRSVLEDLELWEPLKNFMVDRVFRLTTLDDDPTTQSFL